MRSQQLERLALSTVLYHSDIMREEVPTIDPELFETQGMRKVAEAIKEVGPHQVAVLDSLRDDREGQAALIQIIKVYTSQALPLSALESMALRPLKKMRQGRALESAARQSLALIENREIDPAVQVLRERLDEPLPGEDPPAWVKGGQAAIQYMDLFAQLAKGTLPSQIKTGIDLIDRKVNESIGGGFHTGQIACVAARPGRGKSTVMIWMVESVLQNNTSERVGVFSFEMTARDIGKKLTDRLLRRTGKTKTHDHLYGAINAHADLLQRVYIDERSGVDVSEMIATADRMARDGVRVFFVDYIQRVKVGDVAPEAMRLAFGEVVEALTHDAKTKDRLWVILSQFSRAAEGRPGTMADLKETSAIEEHAFWIFGLHRPNEMKRDNDPKPPQLHPTRLEIHILKNRFGPVGEVTAYEADWVGVQLEEVL